MTKKGEKRGPYRKSARTAARIIEAVKETHGFLTTAALRAGIPYRTVEKYASNYPSVIQAVADARTEMKDYAESKLFEAIQAGNMTAIIFYLKTQAKDRGYIERVDSLTAHKAIIEVRYSDEFKKENPE